ncbi:MAG: STAS domain-containing protein [Bacteroidales bacterium]
MADDLKYRVFEIAGNSVLSRAIVDLLFARIYSQASQELILDFEDVEFISRSAAHQLLINKKQFEIQNSTNLLFINLLSNLEKTISTVQESMRSKIQVNPKIEVIESEDPAMIEELLEFR